MKQLRVLLLNYEFPPAGGGAGNATFQIARQLARLGVKVDVLTGRTEKGDEDGVVLDGVRVWRVPSWRKGIHDCGLVGAYSWVAFAAFKRRKLIKRFGYDLEHYFFSLPTGLLSQLPFPRKPPPYIVSLRGSDVPHYDRFNRTLERIHGLLKPITRRIWRKAGAVVTVSEGLKEIARETAPKQPFGVILNGVDTNSFHPPARPRAARRGEPLKVLCVSRLLERKGIQHLLQAIAEPKPLPLTLDVIGTGSYEREMKRRCTELGLDDRVSFVGFVRRDQLPEHYRRAELFALPSITEAFGNVFAEAMACELPVLATTAGGIPELVRDGIHGLLVPPDEVAPIRAALERYLADPEQRLAMARNARQQVEKNFTWEIVARRYLDCYREVVGRTGADVR